MINKKLRKAISIVLIMFLSAHSTHRRLKIICLHALMILVFSMIYFLVAKYRGSDKDKESFKNYESTLYFTTIAHFTIGFGDIAPDSEIMRRISMTHAFSAWWLLYI